jgi:hypothetical protein
LATRTEERLLFSKNENMVLLTGRESFHG